MKRRSTEQVSERLASRKIARALVMDARDIRSGWTAAHKRFGQGRYRWLRAGLRAELARLRMQETPWTWGITA